MTGRDLIIYILQNGLEDDEIIKDGSILGLMSCVEAAIKFDVSDVTVKTWVKIGMLQGYKIGNEIYIPANATNPKERIQNETINTGFGDVFRDCYDTANSRTTHTRASSLFSR